MKRAHALLRFAVALMATTGAAAAPLDFELAGEAGFVRLSALAPQPTLVNFWRSDCAPCVREMPVLAAVARDGRLRVIAVAVQRPAELQSAPERVRQSLRAPIQLLYAPSEPRGLLSRFGDRSGALPYTVLLDPMRRLCSAKSGEIDRAWIEAELARCRFMQDTRFESAPYY